MSITFEADTRNLTAHMERWPPLLRAALRPKITEIMRELLSRVHALEPTRSGALRDLTRMYVDDNEDSITGKVKVLAKSGRRHNVAAAALEFGAHRRTIVRAYSERRDMVFGHRVTERPITVQAYARVPNIAAHRFMRGPFEAMQPRIREELEKTVAETLKKP